MDLLAKIQEAYSSSDESHTEEKQVDTQAIDLAPDVNVSDLQFAKMQTEIDKFKTTNQLITTNNHLNGVIE